MPALEDESIGAVAGRLGEDAKAFARAEIDLQKARALALVGSYKQVAIYGVLALLAVHLALIALTVGLVVAVAQSLGGWWALLIVTVGFLVLATIAGLLAKSKLPGKTA